MAQVIYCVVPRQLVPSFIEYYGFRICCEINYVNIFIYTLLKMGQLMCLKDRSLLAYPSMYDLEHLFISIETACIPDGHFCTSPLHLGHSYRYPILP